MPHILSTGQDVRTLSTLELEDLMDWYSAYDGGDNYDADPWTADHDMLSAEWDRRWRVERRIEFGVGLALDATAQYVFGLPHRDAAYSTVADYPTIDDIPF